MTVRHPLILTGLLSLGACALPPARPTRATIALPYRPSDPVQVGEVVPQVTEIGPAPATPSGSRRFEVESAALTRAFGRPRTVGAEVLLPAGFKPDSELAIAYHVPDLGEDPAQVAQNLVRLQPPAGLVIVVLDPRGIQGHHMFTDSVNEGPHGEALVTDLIPVLEQHLFAGSSPRRRCVVGVGLGGWTAIHLQVEYPHAFDAAFAVDPDPLDLRTFYGADLTSSESTSSLRRLRTMREDGLSKRLACFESALGVRADGGLPQLLFSGKSGALDVDVVKGFARRDPATIVRERGKALGPRLERKIHAAARAGDGWGRDLALRSFAATLETAGIHCSIRTPAKLDPDEAVVGAWASLLATPRL